MASKGILLQSRIRRGKQLIEAKCYEEARSVYQQICAKRKNDADSWSTLGAFNGLLKRHDEAVVCCTRAVELAPNRITAWYNLGIALRDTGQPEKAAAALRKTLRLNPKHEGAATSLGHILIELHCYDEAEEMFRRVLDFQPCNTEFYAVYGSGMQLIGRYEAAVKAYRKVIDSQRPPDAGIYENMGAALCMQGKYQQAVEAETAALKLEPKNARIHSGLLLTSQYLAEETPESVLDRHRHWVGNTVTPAGTLHTLPPVRPERLRIGYVSSDFRKHSVAYFVEPLLAHHDAERYETTCYFTHKDSDATTKRLQQLSPQWRNVADLDDHQFMQAIADDGIDILVDLNGHTSGGRLTVFARRAAPVQVSFIGYPCTTGVTEMDFRLSDAIADPSGAERLYTETLFRLPGCFLCYRPPENSPDVARPPCESNGFITFGSFNNLAKVNLDVIGLWAELLKQLPTSRLVIKNPSLTDKSTRERYRKLFTEAGVSAERLDLIGFVADSAGHLATYGKIDIALDTFPYNGTTTTCEALWMGVPVVSLRGDRHAARVGASLLAAVGFSEWVADTPAQYTQIAQHLAQDVTHLAQLRLALRQQVSRSRLCQEESYTRAVEAAYDEMIACMAS